MYKDAKRNEIKQNMNDISDDIVKNIDAGTVENSWMHLKENIRNIMNIIIPLKMSPQNITYRV